MQGLFRTENFMTKNRKLEIVKQDPVFQKMLRHLYDKFQYHTLILYGSRGKGQDVTDSSDYDIIAICETSENVREALEIDGRFMDAWIYSESITKDPDPSLLRIRGGLIVQQKDKLATNLLNKVEKIFESGPTPIPEWEAQLIITWMQKMYQRSKLGDIEANYRHHWLLFDCLESYFKLRNLWYLGPKESFSWLKIHDKKAYSAFEKALAIGAKDSAIKRLINIVTFECF